MDRPWYSAAGSVEESPTMIRLKKMPIDSTMAEFMNVPAMPAPAPRWSGGRLFMIPVWLGAANSPMARPLRKISAAKPR